MATDSSAGYVKFGIVIKSPGQPSIHFGELFSISDTINIHDGMDDETMKDVWEMITNHIWLKMRHHNAT